jgi:hypothetical protein
VTYWSSHFRASELDRLASQINRIPKFRDSGVTLTQADLGDIKWSDLAVGIDAHMMWTTPVGVYTYVGAGAGVHVLNGQGTFIENTFIEDLLDSTSAAVSIMGGLEAQPLPRFRFYGEARYTIVSELRYPELRIGAALMLPPRGSAPSTPQ